MTESRYAQARAQGKHVFAQTWDDVVWEAQRAVGQNDTQFWLDHFQDILTDPLFVRDPRDAWKSGRKDFFISPHYMTWCKLGCYCVWNGGEIQAELWGSDAVREALLQHRMKQSKL